MRSRRNKGGLQNRSRGFTLVELMMVVAVLAIVTTMAIPGLTHAKRRANETSAIKALRLMATAQNQYRTRFGSFGSVSSLESNGLIDNNFSDGEKSGYDFADAASPSGGLWAVRANPLQPGITGDRYFFVDTSGVIRYRDDGAAGAGDSAID